MSNPATVLPLSRVTPLWREHGPFLGVILASTVGILAAATQEPAIAVPLLDLPSAGFAVVLVVVLAALRLLCYRLRHRVPYGVAWRELRGGALSTDRMVALLIVVAGTRWLLLTAVAWKSSIPTLHPFAYDAPLARLDALLHFGDAWRLLPTHPIWLRMLDTFYYGWFVAFSGVMLWWGWQSPSDARRRFLLSMALLWTVGSLLAVLVSSAGPVYYTAVTGVPSSFDPESVAHLTAGAVQRALWDAYQHGAGETIAGIAAFPSLHVAVPALYALSMPKLRWLWWPFTLLTLVGSVTLLWHYAVDGYAGILLAWGCWRVTR